MRWKLRGGYYEVDITRWILRGKYYEVDIKRWFFATFLADNVLSQTV